MLRPRLDDLILVLSNIYRDKALSVRCEVEDRAGIRCDPDDVDEILGNLLDNAFKWASTAVTVTSTRTGGLVAITITDDGPGIAEDRINEAFQPGMRLDESVQGSGFGLGISKEIVELYGGTVTLQNSKNGFSGHCNASGLPNWIVIRNFSQVQPKAGQSRCSHGFERLRRQRRWIRRQKHRSLFKNYENVSCQVPLWYLSMN